MPHDLIIYDCDGTLLDTERLYGDANLNAIRALGLTHWTYDTYVDRLVGRPWQVGLQVIAEEYGRPLPADFETNVEEEVQRLLKKGLQPLPGVEQAVQAVGGPRCVASSTSLEPLRRNLGLAGILPLFDPHVFSASQVARGKPHPDVFLFAASRMGAEPSGCLVLEDSVPGVQAAVAAGMQVIGFVGAAHDPARIGGQLVEAGACEVIAHMDEWPGLVARRRSTPA